MLCRKNRNVVMWSITVCNATYSESSLSPSAFFALSSVSLTIALSLSLTTIKWAHLAVDVMVGVVQDILDHHCTVHPLRTDPGVTTGDRDRVVVEDIAIVFVALDSTTLELVWEGERRKRMRRGGVGGRRMRRGGEGWGEEEEEVVWREEEEEEE